jgi:hypothetical protein
MGVEETFFSLWNAIATPVDLNELRQLGLSGAKGQQLNNGDQIKMYIWILDTSKGVLDPEVANAFIR